MVGDAWRRWLPSPRAGFWASHPVDTASRTSIAPTAPPRGASAGRLSRRPPTTTHRRGQHLQHRPLRVAQSRTPHGHTRPHRNDHRAARSNWTGRTSVFIVDRLLAEPPTGTRAMHRTVIPFVTADRFEELASASDMPPEQIYAVFAAAGCELAWTEAVTARMPLPDEKAALGNGEGEPLLTTCRVLLGNASKNYLVDEMRIGAHAARFSYPHGEPKRVSTFGH